MGFGSRKELEKALEQRNDMPKCVLERNHPGCSEENGPEGMRLEAKSNHNLRERWPAMATSWTQAWSSDRKEGQCGDI